MAVRTSSCTNRISRALRRVPAMICVFFCSLSCEHDEPVVRQAENAIIPIPLEIENSVSIQQDTSVSRFVDEITVIHWNIGHFSLGKAKKSTISPEDSESMLEKYHLLLDTLQADIAGVCEYNATFAGNTGNTRKLLFGAFPYCVLGKHYSYNFNAVFSTFVIKKAEQFLFEQHVQKRYILETMHWINNEPVVVVETHLDWDEGSQGRLFRSLQLAEIARRYADVPHVIICGDFNTSSPEELDVFKKYGYTLLNDGSMKTYPAGKPAYPLDNIVVNGFHIVNSSIIEDPSLSDHSLIKCNLRFKNS